MNNNTKLFLSVTITALLLAYVVVTVFGENGAPPNVLLKSVSYSSPRIRLTGNNTYIININGGSRTTLEFIPGAPVLPVTVFKMPIDKGKKLEKIEVAYSDVKIDVGRGLRVLRAPVPKPLCNCTPSHAYKELPPGVYPKQRYEYRLVHGIDPLTLEEREYVLLRFYPVLVDELEGYVNYSKSLTVRVYLGETEARPESIGEVDMAVITNSTLVDRATVFAQMKNSTGLVAKVYTTDYIYSNYTGYDEPEKIRNFIKDAHDNMGVKFVVLFGDTEVVPVRYAYIPGLGDKDYIETDLYYADLDGTWDSDGDHFYGEVEDFVDGYPDVLVGRIPVSTPDEADSYLIKLQNYSPDNYWLMRALLLGTVTFGDPATPEGQILKDEIEMNLLPLNFSWKKLYEQTGDLNTTSVLAEINRGYGFVNFAGHGNVNLWYLGSGGYILTSDLYSLTNGYKLPVVFAMSCLTMDFADTDVSIGEAFLLAQNGGGIAYIGASDVAYGYGGYYVKEGLAGQMDLLFFEGVKSFYDNSTTPNLSQLHIYMLSKYLDLHGRSDEYDWYTVVEYGSILGDPSLLINGSGNPPPPTPTPKLSGHVYSSDGPVRGARIKVYDNLTGSIIGVGYTDDNGYYEFQDLPYTTAKIIVETGLDTYTTGSFYLPRKDYRVDVSMTLSSMPNKTVVVVVDNDAETPVNPGYWTSDFTNVLGNESINYLVWSEADSGEPPPALFLNYNVSIVVWHTGTFTNRSVSDFDAQTIAWFLRDGVKLLIEGANVASDHGNDTFLRNVLRSLFMGEKGSANSIVRTKIHPVVLGVPVAPFVGQPLLPDAVAAFNGSYEVAAYDTGGGSIVVYEENGTAKTVFISVPIHYIEEPYRSILINNSLHWLIGDAAEPMFNLTVYTDKDSYMWGNTVHIRGVLNGDGTPVSGAYVVARIYDPNGSLVSTVELNDLGNGSYTGSYFVEYGLSEGTYTLKADASIDNSTVATGVVYFNVSASSDYILEVKTDKNLYMVPDNATVLAILIVNGSLRPGENVTARLYFPNGTLAGEKLMYDLGNGSYTTWFILQEEYPSGVYSMEASTVVNDTVIVGNTTALVSNGRLNFTITINDGYVVNGTVVVNVTARVEEGLPIAMIYYQIDEGGPVEIQKPEDGNYDSGEENVTITFDARKYIGEHKIFLTVEAVDGTNSSKIYIVSFYVRVQPKRYSIIAPYFRHHIREYRASELARSVGANLTGIWWWDTGSQEYHSYIPGLSGPDEDFVLDFATGYFIYLTDESRIVEVGW